MDFLNKILFKKTFAIIIVLSLSIAFHLQSQSTNSNWYFGKNAGVTFKSGVPVALEDGQLNTMEGCASTSDSVGKLLFYTDGLTVWNRHHMIMPNGKELNGHTSSTQSAYIVPHPHSNTLYYLFTSDFEAGKKGLCYSVVDMQLNNGYGDIAEKNILLRSSCVEKIAAYEHANKNDIWLVIHEYNSSSFLAYLITNAGISPKPVISSVGLKYEKNIFNTIGYMKFSPDGKRLATVITGSFTAEIFNFDNNTGIVSHPVTIVLEDNSMPYGLEFSPNNKLLYIGSGAKGKVYQYNVSLDTEDKIINSMIEIGKSKSGKSIGSLQLAEDNKIYVAEYLSKYLSIIENPDKIGTDCKYVNEKVNLNKISTFGLPVCYHRFKKGTTRLFQNSLVYDRTTEILLNQKYRLNNILFESDKSEVRAELFKDLDKVVELLHKKADLKILIIGHTDSIGKERYNYRLSLRRANEVRDYLISKDVDPKQVKVVGKGLSEPIDCNSTEIGRENNRRVEFIISKYENKQKAEL